MDKKIKQFDKWIKSQIKNNWILSGISIAIFDDKKVLYKYIYGTRDINTMKKIKDTDRFCIASCSKSYLCTAIWKLIEDKEIPHIYEKTLGEIFNNNIHNDYKSVKVESLANNISGIPWNLLNIYQNKELYTKIYKNINGMEPMESNKTLALRVLSIPPLEKPETKFIYSSIGFQILAHILEIYTRKPFYESIDEKVFKVLKMKSATLNNNSNNVKGHRVIESGFIPPESKDHKYFVSLDDKDFIDPSPSAWGGIWCTTNDSVIYLQEYMKTINKTSKFLDNNTIEKILSTKSLIRDRHDQNYNFGWIVSKNHIGHAGGWTEMDTNYYIDINNNIGLVVNIIVSPK